MRFDLTLNIVYQRHDNIQQSQQHTTVLTQAAAIESGSATIIATGVAKNAASEALTNNESSRSSFPFSLCESDLPLADGLLIRMSHEDTPLCFDLDHYVRKQGWTQNSLSQSICLSQSLMSVEVVQVTRHLNMRAQVLIVTELMHLRKSDQRAQNHSHS